MRLKVQDLVVNLSSAVAEWQKTIDGFVDVARSLRNIKRRILGRGGRRIDLCDVSSMHLAIQYGVKPVVSDFYDVVQSFSEKSGQMDVIRLYTRSHDSSNVSVDDANWTGNGEWETSEAAVFYVQPVVPDNSIDLGNPVEWAWEAIPFSFVVDWCIPVGDWLTSLDALKNVNVLGGVVTRKERFRGTFDCKVSGSYAAEAPSTVSYESHSRGVYGTIPLPPFPRWEPTHSFAALQNAAALLHQVRGC
jgi:hypothetical protein